MGDIIGRTLRQVCCGAGFQASSIAGCIVIRLGREVEFAVPLEDLVVIRRVTASPIFVEDPTHRRKELVVWCRHDTAADWRCSESGVEG